MQKNKVPVSKKQGNKVVLAQYTFGVLSILLSSPSFAVTNGIEHSLPGLVKIESPDTDGSCTGSIIGDAPIKVSLAVHCLSNHTTGGVKIQVPGETRMIESKKVYLSSNPEFLKKLEAKTALVEKLKEKTKEITALKADLDKLQADTPSIIDGFLKSPVVLAAEEVARKNAIEENLKKGAMLGFEIQMTSMEIMEDTQEIAFKHFAEELAVVVFDESLPDSDATLEEKVETLHILPVSREALPNAETTTLVGGFGITSRRGGTTPDKSKLTVNIVSPSKKQKDAYVVFGYSAEDSQKFGIQKGTFGAILPGDSGGPVLTPYGMAGVASMINSYSSENPPREGWKNSFEENEPFAEYKYIQCLYPSTSSPVAREILARVEQETSPIVYADQIPSFAAIFEREVEKIQRAPKTEAPAIFQFFDLTLN